MTSNNIEMQPSVPEIIVSEDKSDTPNSVPQHREFSLIKVLQSSIILIANILIGATLGITYLFAFRDGLPLDSTSMHVVLCVTGYQLLMAQAILSLSTENGWLSRLSLVNKRKGHGILQILGSGLAIGGTIHKILNETSHWDNVHGIFGLIALVFTSVSLVNGFASLHANDLRKILPGNLSKITHVCFGTTAFVSASVCLCLGMAKDDFTTSKSLSSAAIAVVAILTFIVVINPIITFYNKSVSIMKK